MYHYSSGIGDKKLKRKLLISALIGFIPFISIAIIGYFNWDNITMVDYEVSGFFYQLHGTALNSIVTLITHLGDRITQIFVVVFAVVTLLILKKWRTALWYGLTALIGGGILNFYVKEFYGRVRPDQIDPLVSIGGYSFPSGHAMGSLVVYGGILFMILRFVRSRRLKIFLSVLVFLMVLSIGLSRIYLAVHFPSDVIGGFSLGFSSLCLSISLLGLKYTKKESRSRNRYSIKTL